MKKVLVDLTIKEVQRVNANCVLLVMGCDQPLPATFPGQFAELRIDNTPTVMLRRPISVHSFDAQKNEVGFLVQLVGDGTRWLGSLKVGDKVNTLMPLGNGFTLPEAAGKRYLLVGGGVGSAPLYYLAQELKAVTKSSRRGHHRIFKVQTTYFYICLYHFSSSIENTGPSVHTHLCPSFVSSTQQRHAPRPQAILFSRETSQPMPFSRAYLATESIIGFGPQVNI